jgi:D-tyrosyl-tRNA(Tyr) deacylase
MEARHAGIWGAPRAAAQLRSPSLLGAGDPKRAEELYLAFVQRFRDRGVQTKTGSFGADMTVSIDNDGPVTLVLSTEDWPTRV